ncbi:MAG TPA: hypothetical protein VK463_01310 [Desulfomonilaceae bacterium]|nr:hypothetical protein [Desulfomonilaceae bacterium]
MTDRSSEKSLQAGPEQILYASVLEKGMYFGLLLVILTYLIYVLGIVKPYIPLADVPKMWGLGVSTYLHEANIHAGWAWLWLIRYSDFLNFVPIAALAGVTVLCFLAIVPVLWKENDRLYAFFALLEALILGVAASGILGAGGH